MKYLVFGSMNIDRVYSLAHLPEKGETLSCVNYEIHVGGKGLNQALSLSKAGAEVYMAGQIGADGAFLKNYLKKNGADVSLVEQTDGFTGHAVIEVDPEGQNQMVLFPGANREITPDFCDRVLEGFEKGDVVLMQYETSCVEYMTAKAHEKGLKTVFNPSPFVPELKDFDYGDIDMLILNESEGQSITALSGYEDICRALLEKMSGGTVILTLGADGAVFADGERMIKVPAFRVNAVDTTGAGDTFTGYITTELLKGTSPEKALRTASAASAVAVTKPGAAETIPTRDEVAAFLKSTLKY